MLGKLSRKHETDSSLDLSAGKSGLLVVGGKLSSFSGNALKDIIDERVHDGHSLLGDSSVRVDLLEHLVDVGRVGLSTLLGLGLACSSLLGCLGRLLGGCLGHGGNKEFLVERGLIGLRVHSQRVGIVSRSLLVVDSLCDQKTSGPVALVLSRASAFSTLRSRFKSDLFPHSAKSIPLGP